MHRGLIICTPLHMNSPASPNTPAVVVLAARPNQRRFVAQVEWSFNRSPSSGVLLTIENGLGNVVKSYDIVSEGPGHMPWPLPLAGAPGAAWRITLGAGGNGRFGKVMVSEFVPNEDLG